MANAPSNPQDIPATTAPLPAAAAPVPSTAPPTVRGPEQALYDNPKPFITFPAPYDHVTVRAFRPSDSQALAKRCNNRNIWLRMSNTFPSPYTLPDAEKFIRSALVQSALVATGEFDVDRDEGVGEKCPTNLAVCWDDELIGGVGATFLGDVRMRTAMFGYWLAEDYWGKGIMSQVGPATANYFFATYGRMMRMVGAVYDGNDASCKIMEKSGFHIEYRDRKGIWKDKKLLNCHVYGRVRED